MEEGYEKQANFNADKVARLSAERDKISAGTQQGCCQNEETRVAMQTTMQSLKSTPFLAGRTCRKASIASMVPSVRSRTGRRALVVRAEKPQVQCCSQIPVCWGPDFVKRRILPVFIESNFDHALACDHMILRQTARQRSFAWLDRFQPAQELIPTRSPTSPTQKGKSGHWLPCCFQHFYTFNAGSLLKSMNKFGSRWL